jgi:hypothetical protein
MNLSIDVNWRRLAFSSLYLSRVSPGIVRRLADSRAEDALAFLNKRKALGPDARSKPGKWRDYELHARSRFDLLGFAVSRSGQALSLRLRRPG